MSREDDIKAFMRSGNVDRNNVPESIVVKTKYPILADNPHIDIPPASRGVCDTTETSSISYGPSKKEGFIGNAVKYLEQREDADEIIKEIISRIVNKRVALELPISDFLRSNS